MYFNIYCQCWFLGSWKDGHLNKQRTRTDTAKRLIRNLVSVHELMPDITPLVTISTQKVFTNDDATSPRTNRMPPMIVVTLQLHLWIIQLAKDPESMNHIIYIFKLNLEYKDIHQDNYIFLSTPYSQTLFSEWFWCNLAIFVPSFQKVWLILIWIELNSIVTRMNVSIRSFDKNVTRRNKFKYAYMSNEKQSSGETEIATFVNIIYDTS